MNKTAPSIVIPLQDIDMNCGKCGYMGFTVKVFPQNNAAKVNTLTCGRCKNVFRIDTRGFIEGDGKLTKTAMKPITQKEIDNG